MKNLPRKEEKIPVAQSSQITGQGTKSGMANEAAPAGSQHLI
jgi:hypothetical protein